MEHRGWTNISKLNINIFVVSGFQKVNLFINYFVEHYSNARNIAYPCIQINLNVNDEYI